MRRLCVLAAFAGIVLSATPGRAADHADNPAVTTVTVTAPSPKRVPQIIDQFSQPFSGDRLSRWRQPVCPFVQGLTPEQNTFIAHRIIEIAKAARLLTPSKACDHNILIVASGDDLAFRRKVERRAEGVFSTDIRWPVDKNQLSDFTHDDGAPVHVFYSSGEVSPFVGGPPVDLQGGLSDAADTSGALSLFGAPVTRASASRLTPAVDIALTRVVVVVDGRQLKGVSPEQLAAYLSMITLAEVRVKSPLPGVDTITNLFADMKAEKPAPADLTFWDRAYLGALYNAPTEVNIAMQKSVMANRIQRAIEVLKLPTDDGPSVTKTSTDK